MKYSTQDRSSLSLLAAALLGLVGSASASQDAPSVFEDLKLRALGREQALGLERIQVGTGGYHYRLPRGLETPELRESKGLIWAYDGQEVFTEGYDPAVPLMVKLQPEERRTVVESLLGTVEVDQYGRRWQVIGVEDDGLVDAIAAYDSLVQGTVGLEPGVTPQDPLLPESDEDSEDLGWVRWVPLTWYMTNCDSDSDAEIMRWGSDGRSESSNPMSTRQVKVVIVTSPRGRGTGVMVDSNTVLTAAHVVSNSSGSKYSASNIDVMTRGNYQAGALALGATSVTLPSSYSGDGDFSDDYALIDLSSSPGVGWMAISQASNSTIKSAKAYTTGHPGFGPGCASTSESAINSGFTAATQYWGTGNLFGTTSKRIKTRLDAGPGQSGSPIYYYPGGCCGSHYVTGVLSGYVDVWVGNDYVGGPKGRSFRSWAIANM